MTEPKMYCLLFYHSAKGYFMKIKSIFHIVAAWLMLVLTSEFSLTIAYDICDTNPWARIVYVILNIFSLLAAFYLYTRYFMKIRMQDIRLGKPFPERKWCITAVIMPLAICCFYLLFVKGTFASQNLTLKDLINVLTLSVLSLGILPAVTEEMVFRGMILGTLQSSFGKKTAVFVSSILFALYHLEYIDSSDWKKVVLLIVSVGIIGYALSLVTLQTRSIWSAVVIHGMYNILSGESQILHIDMEQNFPAMWTYTVSTQNPLLTGINGAVGFTAAIPSVAGFIAIIIMVKYYEKKEKKAA